MGGYELEDDGHPSHSKAMTYLPINGSSCACSRGGEPVSVGFNGSCGTFCKSYLATRSHFSMHSEQKRCMQPDTRRQSFTMPASRASLLKPWHATATSRHVFVSRHCAMSQLGRNLAVPHLSPKSSGMRASKCGCKRMCKTLAKGWLAKGHAWIRRAGEVVLTQTDCAASLRLKVLQVHWYGPAGNMVSV